MLKIINKWISPFKDFNFFLALKHINKTCPQAFNILQIWIYKGWNRVWIIDYWIPVLFLSDIMNQKGRLAWELYLKMGTSSDSFSLLQLIANDCYKVTSFYVFCYRVTVALAIMCVSLFYIMAYWISFSVRLLVNMQFDHLGFWKNCNRHIFQ